MNNFESLVEAAGSPVILDGAIGSVLIARGLDRGIPPETWNLEHPDAVRQLHEEYFRAGSHIVHTNTFGGTRIRLSEFRLDVTTDEINRAGVQLVEEVRPEGRLIAGDMGPTGKLAKPMGPCSESDWFESFYEQANILGEAGADFISIETMYDLKEAVTALKAVKQAGLPAWVSMTFRSTPRGYFTIMGNSLADCFHQLESEGADGIGSNCTLDGAEMAVLADSMMKSGICPMHLQPNAGKPALVDGNLCYTQTPREFTNYAMKILDTGVKAIGGCCGSTPEFIRELRRGLAETGGD